MKQNLETKHFSWIHFPDSLDQVFLTENVVLISMHNNGENLNWGVTATFDYVEPDNPIVWAYHINPTPGKRKPAAANDSKAF